MGCLFSENCQLWKLDRKYLFFPLEFFTQEFIIIPLVYLAGLYEFHNNRITEINGKIISVNSYMLGTALCFLSTVKHYLNNNLNDQKGNL